MSALFSYRWEHPSGATFEVIFKHPGTSSTADFATALNGVAQGVLYPDGVLVVCLQSDSAETAEMLSRAKIKQSVYRFRGKTSLHLVVVDITCQPIEIIRMESTAATNNLCDLHSLIDVFPKILSRGVDAVFADGKAIIRAPSGFEFVKPSGEKSSHFLRTEEALSTSASVDFLAFALLSRLRVDDLKVIFVDSMAISSIAYSLREMLYKLKRGSPQIISFHSHGGMHNIEVPPHKTFFCIISASSSMSLQRRWVAHTHCADDDVVTLLTFLDAQDATLALCKLPRPYSWKAGDTPAAGIRPLRVYGERFHPEQISPKKITLALNAHRCEKVEKFAKDFCDLPLLSINGLDDQGHRRTVLVHGPVLTESPPFKVWLQKQLRARIPASIQGIVFQNDCASRMMAQMCATYLAELSIDLTWGVRASSDLDSGMESLHPERALLIVAAVISKGALLLGVSRDLRAFHTGAKTYLVGMQLCESSSDASFLKRNLTQTKDKTCFFDCHHTLAIGSALQQSFRDEAEAIRLGDARADALQYRWNPSRQEGLVEDSLLPSLVVGDHRLKLRPDFVFWNCPYNEGARHAPMVLVTIGAILQRARTEEFSSDDHRLASEAFQQVVLDPQNFNRYNDGIIQAAILRQAYPSELDYSSLPIESRYMVLLLKKMFASRAKQQGEAIAEFAFALGTGRLKLQPSDQIELSTWLLAHISDQAGDRELASLIRHGEPGPHSGSGEF
ncbi:hypothetical protein [Bordetella bronchiseptica]|uniref:hypothetical protein n=1 Tax=Bordetella bronchiseptica TaxID=518 RepID=UPI00045A3285|nr:hypothetical protein [Bordetella bronchiseptica]KCV52001.1 hypothetical protein L492_0506 [Bordetella bronchiseptica 7E71]